MPPTVVGAWLQRVFATPKPEVLLALGAFAAVVWEWLVLTPRWAEGGANYGLVALLPPSLAVGAVLLLAYPRRKELSSAWVVGLAVLMYLAFLAVHQSGDGPTHKDISELYPRYGESLLQTGELPSVEYPPGAIIAFAAARALGSVDLTLPLLTLPLMAVAWYSLSRQSAQGPWLVACLGLLPPLEIFWELRYDGIPAALAVLGLVMAARQRWGFAGLLLGLGAGTKWYPGLAVIVLAAGLVGTPRRAAFEPYVRLVGAAAFGFALVHLPFIGDLDALVAPYQFHAERGFMAESLPYLPLHFLGFADLPDHAWGAVVVPAWAKPANLLVIATALVGLTLAAFRGPSRALSLAAAAPVAFLLLNRVFSPQFLLPVAALWVTSLVLQPENGFRERLFLGFLVTAAIATYAVSPADSPYWVPLQLVLFLAAIGATLVALGFPRPSSNSRAPLALVTQESRP